MCVLQGAQPQRRAGQEDLEQERTRRPSGRCTTWSAYGRTNNRRKVCRKVSQSHQFNIGARIH